MMARVAIAVKRAYDPVSRADGTRFLVERLWPRGISEAKLRADAWLKEAGPAPSCGSGSATIPRSGRSSVGGIAEATAHVVCDTSLISESAPTARRLNQIAVSD